MRHAALGIAIVGLGGCSPRLVDTFAVEADLDVVFAIDKSGSMDDDARRLGASFGDFIDAVGEATGNWQIGVVTTDSGCFDNGILTADTPDYEALFLDAVTRRTWVEPTTTEALLEMVDGALVKTGPTGCNAGFRREDAALHVVTVSDEREQSGRPADYWVERWQAHLADPSRLVVSAVVDAAGRCGGEAGGYVEAVDATGGLLLDLCSSDWPAFAAALGEAAAGDLRTFRLSSVPVPDSIRVEIDGERYDDWRYEDDENAVILDEDDDLVGATVQILYREA